MTPLAQLTDVSVQARDRIVLGPLDVTLQPGELVALYGPNGAGKSVLLHVLAGLVTPTGGEARIQGEPCHQLARDKPGTVGLVTAVPGLYPLLTGRENLHFFGSLHGLGPADIDARLAPLLDELELTDSLDRAVGEYSSGMQQKVSLARALLLDPALLLLDEPTANLDPASAHTLHRVLRQRADRGLTVVLATHDLALAEQIADRGVLLQTTVRRSVPLAHAPEPSPGPLLSAWEAELGKTGTATPALVAPSGGPPRPPGVASVVRREWLEQRRQPWMLATMGSLIGIISGLVIVTVVLLGVVSTGDTEQIFATALSAFGIAPDNAVPATVSALVGLFHFLLFTQLLGMTAVLAGHAVLHDRQVGTLPFLLLTPLPRGAWLMGKVLGAVGTPLLLYGLFGGLASLYLSLSPLAVHEAAQLPFSGGWVVAFFLGGPAWATFVATVCAVLSAVARDVRTAQQGVWFLLFFTSLLCGWLLGGLMDQGAALQSIVAATGALCALIAGVAGNLLLARDLSR